LSSKHRCVYAIYIQSTPEAVWRALTDADQTAAYWAHRNVSDWRAGSRWEHRHLDGSQIADVAGDVVESTPPTRLVLTWANPVDGTPVAIANRMPTEEGRAGGPSRVTYAIEPHGAIVRLTVTHDGLADDAERDALAAGWAAVLSNLKTFLETGRPLPRAPWEMLPGFVRS
jgi:uncharacterized protein YndB with AHSA1/START domain